MNKACGISHLMPRDLSVGDDGRIQIVPVPEIANLKVGKTVDIPLNGAELQLGSQVMVTLSCHSMPRPPHIHHHRGTVPPKAQNAVGVDVLVDHSTGEWTRIGYDLDSGVIFVDQSHTNSYSPSLSDAYQTTDSLPVVMGGAVAKLNITVLVDGGLLESYANDHVVISSLLSPSSNGSSHPEARGVRAFWVASNAGASNATGPTCQANAWKLRKVQ